MGVPGKGTTPPADATPVGIPTNGNEPGIKPETCNWGLFNASSVTPVGLSCVKLLGSLYSSPNPQGLTPCGLTRAGMLPCICEGESSVGTTGREGRFSPIG